MDKFICLKCREFLQCKLWRKVSLGKMIDKNNIDKNIRKVEVYEDIDDVYPIITDCDKFVRIDDKCLEIIKDYGKRVFYLEMMENTYLEHIKNLEDEISKWRQLKVFGCHLGLF